jgi:hypothetical protein
VSISDSADWFKLNQQLQQENRKEIKCIWELNLSLLLRETELEYTRGMPSSGKLRHVTLVRTEVLEECRASIIRVTRIAELGTTIAR